MTLTDYILDIALIAIVLLQVRGRRLTIKSLLIPLAIVAYVAHSYLHGIPTAGNDLVLVVGATLVGTALGALCGVFTRVTPDAEGVPVAKAGAVAAILWVLGVGLRFAFQLYATHGGGDEIMRLSASYHITSSETWVAALLLMAIGEAVARTAVLAGRGWRMGGLRRSGAGVRVRPSTIMVGSDAQL